MGYLKRELRPEVPAPLEMAALPKKSPYILVTPGGGGDGAELVDAVLSAYERFNERLPWPALIVYGPFLPARQRTEFERRAARLERITTLTFHEHLENLMEEAIGVVCLGGYNTFCEVLSLNKRSIMVPRVTPRAEQLLRADTARKLGLVQVISPFELTPQRLAEALIHLPDQPAPAKRRIPGLLNGLRNINAAVGRRQMSGRRGT
jgi:predicted glycosyltransferase